MKSFPNESTMASQEFRGSRLKSLGPFAFRCQHSVNSRRFCMGLTFTLTLHSHCLLSCTGA